MELKSYNEKQIVNYFKVIYINIKNNLKRYLIKFIFYIIQSHSLNVD